MKDYLELTPELLVQQSQEMMTLKAQYEILFENLLKDLQGMNASWSPNLSHNFAGKISSAQKGFAGVAKMLENGSYAAILAANNLGGADANIGKFISGNTRDVASMIETAKGFLKNADKITGASDAWEDAKELYGKLEKIKENYKGELSSSQEAWIDYVLGKGKKWGLDLAEKGGMLSKADKNNIKTFETTMKITEKLLEGDWEGAMETAGVSGVKEFVKVYTKSAGIDTGDYITGKKVEWYTEYGINLFKDGVSGVTEVIYEGPTPENIGKLGWNLTAQPILDTSGKFIYEQVSMIPGISEYYIDEKRCENIGDMGSVALGEYYSIISSDPEMREYASNYYKDAGGLWEGMWDCGEEWNSFVKDSGGWGEAIKNYSKTAWKDFKSDISHNMENVEILWNEGKDWVENVGDFVDEQGGVVKATGEFIETAAKDAWNAVSDAASGVWNSIFSKETVDILKGKK